MKYPTPAQQLMLLDRRHQSFGTLTFVSRIYRAQILLED